VLMHGERDMPPKHGVAVGDVLDALGVPTDLAPEAVERGIEETGIGYLRQERFAPDLFAIKWLREEIALRSPLNMVEKIYDPAGAPYHLVGLTHLPYLDKLGDALSRMGFRKSAVVQGLEGNEDLPTNRAARVIEFESDGQGGASKREYRLDAKEYGLTPATAQDLAPGEAGGRPTAERSAQLTLDVLRGEASDAWRDLVLFNAGFRIELSGHAPDLAGAIERARAAIDAGDALRLLERWREAG
ncbi:MAG: hypothetical protein U1B78_03615, partial [Dehalococcoidia bacterium]|nr:hypothetical protein [Dehalococcoidia bacterium]